MRSQLNVSYEHKKELTLIGFSTEIAPDEGYEKCPRFWEEQYARRFARLWQTMQPQNALEQAILDNGIGMYAICADDENHSTYWIAGEYKGGHVPEGLRLYTFPESDWAVFSARGPLPDSLQSLNTAVWHDWLPTVSGLYDTSGATSLEVYSAGDPTGDDYECGIWIPVRKKS